MDLAKGESDDEKQKKQTSSLFPYCFWFLDVPTGICCWRNARSWGARRRAGESLHQIIKTIPNFKVYLQKSFFRERLGLFKRFLRASNKTPFWLSLVFWKGPIKKRESYESKAKIFYRIFFPFKFGVLDVPAGIRGRWGPFGCDTIAACGPRCSTRNAATCRILT